MSIKKKSVFKTVAFVSALAAIASYSGVMASAANVEDDLLKALIVSSDNTVKADSLEQFKLSGDSVAKGVSDKDASLEVNLNVNTFSSTLTDYNNVVVEKTVAAKKAAEEKKRKEEEERKKREEEERKRQEEEARKKKLEEALRRAEETGENVPNEDTNCRSWIKTYMGYQAVTNPRSYQYWLLNSQFAYTDPETGLRMYDDSGDGTDPRYCIAMGSFYTTTIGQKIDLQLEDGSIVHCILGDAKADVDTNEETHQFGNVNGDVAEFIIDDTVYYTKYDRSGTVNWVDGLWGSIYKVMVLDEYGGW